MANTRHPVLINRIPPGGRALARLERTRLVQIGVNVPVRSHVARAHGSDYIGALYVPMRGGLSDLGVSVKMPAAI
jgi:hypothetical protein